MTKRFHDSAGDSPRFISGSFTSTNRQARVTGRTVNGVRSVATSEYETRTSAGHINHLAYVAECECSANSGPSQATLEQAANAFIYGSSQVAGNRNSRDFQDNPANRCTECHLLMSRNGRCDNCHPEIPPVMPFKVTPPHNARPRRKRR